MLCLCFINPKIFTILNVTHTRLQNISKPATNSNSANAEFQPRPIAKHSNDSTFIAPLNVNKPSEKWPLCSHCGKSGALYSGLHGGWCRGLYRCNRCRQAYYCNRDCQVAHWEVHSIVCRPVPPQPATLPRNATSICLPMVEGAQQSYVRMPSHEVDRNKVIQRKKDHQDQSGLFGLAMVGNIHGITKKEQAKSIATYHTRIGGVLSRMANVRDLESANMADLVCDEYEDNASLFVQDYADYINDIEIGKKYKHTNGSNGCVDAANCRFLQRRFGEKSDGKRRPKRRAFDRLCDNLHTYRHHLVHLGVRNPEPEQSDEKQLNVLLQMINSANDNNLMFNKAPIATNSNKFITEISEEKQAKYQSYSSGIRFYYHEYYKHNQKDTERLPGHGPDIAYRELGNKDIDWTYKFCDWYIRPKYNSLKEEIANISHNAYDTEMAMAALKWTALAKYIKTANNEWCIVYGMKRDSSIELKHVLALLLYTNCDSLQNKFTKTFRRRSLAETDEQLKQRHSAFAHWAKALRECVEVFGKFSYETPNIGYFFHGVSQIMVFEHFEPRFKSPTSTTTDIAVAAQFATRDKNGMIVAIENDRLGTYFFDCQMWSDFPWEQEKLFIGGHWPLRICGIVMSNGLELYVEWIRAMRIFTVALMHGHLFYGGKVRKSDVEYIHGLISSVLTKNEYDDEYHSTKSIPVYVQHSFKHMIDKQKRIQVNLGLLNKDHVCRLRYASVSGIQDYYGYRLLRHFYLTESNEIKWSVLRHLYPALQYAYIVDKQPVKLDVNHTWAGNARYEPSVCIDDALISDIQSFLSSYNNSRSQIKHVYIYYPSNSLDDLKQIRQKHMVTFLSMGYLVTIHENRMTSDDQEVTIFIIRKTMPIRWKEWIAHQI